MKRKSQSNVGEVALKIDIIKAYDRIKWGYLRATPTGVGIRGAISITAKMAPKASKTLLQRRRHRRWQNAIFDFEVPYLAPLERDEEGCKIAVMALNGYFNGYIVFQNLYKSRDSKKKKTYLESFNLKP